MYRLVVRVVFIAVAGVIILLILFRNRLPFGEGNSSFATEPGQEITGIEFSDNGKKLLLQKKDEIWVINEKTEARKSGISRPVGTSGRRRSWSANSSPGPSCPSLIGAM